MHDPETVERLLADIRSLAASDLPGALACALEAVAAARGLLASAATEADATAATELLTRGLASQSRLLLMQNRWDEVGSPAEQALELAESLGMVDVQVWMLTTIGTLASDQGDQAAAIGRLSVALRLAREAGLERRVLAAHEALGVSESRLGDDEAALEHYRAALALIDASSPRRHYAEANLSLSLRRLGRLEQALEVAGRVIEGMSVLGDEVSLANELLERGVLFHLLGRWREAREDLDAGLVMLEGHDQHALEAAGLRFMAELLLDPANPAHDPQAALLVLRRALDAVEAGAFDEERRAVEDGLAKAYEALGHYELALHHQRRHERLALAAHERNRDRALAAARADLGLEAARTDARAARAAQIALKDTNERLSAAMQERQILTDMMRHDLRGPLMSLLWLAESMDDGGARAAAPPKSIAKLRRLVERMLDTVEQAAARTPGSASQPTLGAMVDLDGVVAEVLGELEQRALAKEIEIEIEGVSGASATLSDRTGLVRSLANFASNALKFSPPGSAVSISLEAVSDGRALVVADRGPGLTEADEARAFKPFQTLSNRPTGGEESSGLGLAIAARLMRDIGGRAWYELRPGGGSRFGLTLPEEPS